MVLSRSVVEELDKYQLLVDFGQPL